MNSVLTSVWRIFTSRRFAIVLLIAIAFLLLLGILLPTLSYHKPEEMADFQLKHPILFEMGKIFNPPALASSWTFLILAGLLLTSTLCCSIQRIVDHEFRDPFMGEPRYFRQRQSFVTADEPAQIANRVRRVLRARHWRIGTGRRGGAVSVTGEKGAAGFWGSIAFHLGFLVILVGVVISARTRFVGTILVTEGQTVPIRANAFVKIDRQPQRLDFLPGGSLTLMKLTADYKSRRFPVDYTAQVTVADGRGLASGAEIKVNKAINYGGLTFLLEDYGFAPGLMVTNSEGKTLLDAYINFKGRTGTEPDAFNIPGGIKVNTRVFPDYFEPRPGVVSTRSEVANRPALAVSAEKGGRTLFRGLLPKGKSVRFGGIKLAFNDLRYWAYLRATRDLGIPLIFWGFVMCATGLIVRFVLHQRHVAVAVVPDGRGVKVTVSGRSRYFPALFKEELRGLADELEGKVGTG